MINNIEIILLKLIISSVHYVSPLNFNELIPILATLLVEKAHSMHQLMDNCSNLNAAAVEGERLTATSSAEFHVFVTLCFSFFDNYYSDRLPIF